MPYYKLNDPCVWDLAVAAVVALAIWRASVNGVAKGTDQPQHLANIKQRAWRSISARLANWKLLVKIEIQFEDIDSRFTEKAKLPSFRVSCH